MEFWFDEKQNSVLNVRLDDVNYIIETKFKSEAFSHSFLIKDVEMVEDDHYKVHWYHDAIGSIFQEFLGNALKKRGCNQKITLGRFITQFIPTENVEGMIDQSFGFEPENEPYFMIPGHIYNSNNIKNSKGIQPQLNYRGDIKYPKTSVIYTRADRSTHNAVISMHGKSIIGVRMDETTHELCGMKSSYNKELEYLYNGLGIDTRNQDPFDRISVTMGYHHFPVHYMGKLGPASHSKNNSWNKIHFGHGIEYTTSGHFYFAEIENKFGYEDCIQYFYEQIHEHPGNQVDREGAINDMVKALVEEAYNHEHHYFPTVLSGLLPDTGASGDTAWTGGMQVVYPMIRASRFVDGALDVPLDYIRHLVDSGFKTDANFFYESKNQDAWSISGWWKNDLTLYDENLNVIPEAFSAYVNGQATTYILKSYRFLMDELENERPLDLSFEELNGWFMRCKQIVDHVISHQRYDGALGVYYEASKGLPIYFNSFQGAWFLAAIAEMYLITGDKRYAAAFAKADSFYWQFLERLELWGMPMDTQDAVDEEGNLAYVTAMKTMHEASKDKKLIEQLVHCLHYEFSWKFAYNTVHVNEPLKSLNWPSSGGSITSSHNIHIHQMGNLICEEMYYVYEQTKNPYILARLKDTLNWGLGTHNSETYDFGFGQRGWATEQFFHTDGKQDDPTRIVDGGIWYDYLSWAAACCLLSCSLDIPDELYKTETEMIFSDSNKKHA